MREGKQKSSWSNPNTAYETALQRFVQTVLDATRANPFLVEFHAFGETLGRLAQLRRFDPRFRDFRRASD